MVSAVKKRQFIYIARKRHDGHTHTVSGHQNSLENARLPWSVRTTKPDVTSA